MELCLQIENKIIPTYHTAHVQAVSMNIRCVWTVERIAEVRSRRWKIILRKCVVLQKEIGNI